MLDSNLLDKLHHLKSSSEENKSRLDQLKIVEEAEGRLVRVTMNGNRVLEELEINANLASISKEDLISIALNRSLTKINELNEQEAMNSAQSLFSGM